MALAVLGGQLALGRPPFPQLAHRGLALVEQGLDRADRLVDQEIDGLVDGLADLLHDGLDLFAYPAQPQEGRQETYDHGDGLGQGLLDQGRSRGHGAAGDGGQGIEDGVDQVRDLGGALDEEDRDVDDGLAGLDEGGDRVEQADEPGDAGDDNLRDHEVLDTLDDGGLDVAHLFLDVRPQARRALRDEDLEDLGAGFQSLDDALAHDLDRTRTDVGVGEAEHLHEQEYDALEVQAVGHLDAGLAQGAQQPSQEARLEMLADPLLEAQDAALDRGDKVGEEADGMADDLAHDGCDAGQEVEDGVHQLLDDGDDFLDEGDDGVHQAPVGGLELLDAGVQLFQVLLVLLRQGIDELVLLVGDALLQLRELVLDLLRFLPSDFPQGRIQGRHVFVHLLAPLGNQSHGLVEAGLHVL